MAESRHLVSEEITNALMDLMAEKPFTEITVTDVVNRAGVARASFYRNFSSTGEILDLVLGDFIREFKEHALPVLLSQDERAWRSFLFRYIYFVQDHRRRLMIWSNSNASIILYKMAEAAHDMSCSCTCTGVKEKYSISTRIGAINSVIMRWLLEPGESETPEELVDYMMSFILTI
ncbi:MAG: TetR/AcrR family transcriptional regulator [Sarcina sp.]|nr:TetR/AcrR family transcriptional regulator [Sarcina sp.]